MIAKHVATGFGPVVAENGEQYVHIVPGAGWWVSAGSPVDHSTGDFPIVFFGIAANGDTDAWVSDGTRLVPSRLLGDVYLRPECRLPREAVARHGRPPKLPEFVWPTEAAELPVGLLT